MSVYLEHSGKSLKWGIWKMEETIEDLLSILPERAYYEKELQRFNAPNRTASHIWRIVPGSLVFLIRRDMLL